MVDDWIAVAPKLREVASPLAAGDFDALIAEARPVVMRGLVADWPAVAAAKAGSDTLAGLLRGYDGGRPLGLFAGSPAIGGRFFYRDDMAGYNFERGQVLLPALLDALLATATDPTPPALYAGANAADEHFPGWTRDHRLPLPSPAAEATARLWIGNGSRVSAHFDMSDNVAAVVAGRRRVVLFPPDQVGNLYIGPFDATMAGQPTSMVDLEQPDHARYPLFRVAQEAAQVADLSPGDAIFIPAMWWHEIRATGPLNVLVNYWWTVGTPDAPFAVLVHGILAIRDRPASERAAFRAWFDHYVFGEGARGAADHLPPSARSVLGPPGPDRDARIRGFLRRMLGGS